MSQEIFVKQMHFFRVLLDVNLHFQDVGGNTAPNASNSLSYNQLVSNFTTIYRSMAKQEGLKLDSSDVAISVNQIKAFLGEFVIKKGQSHTHREVPAAKPKPRHRKKTPSTAQVKEVKVRFITGE